MQSWGSSLWGERFTGSAPWHLTLRGFSIELASGSTQWLATADTDAVHVTPGYFWSEVQISSQNGHKVKVDGIPNAEAAKMMSAISSASGTASGGRGPANTHGLLQASGAAAHAVVSRDDTGSNIAREAAALNH